MGLEQSRLEQIDLEKITKGRTIKFWLNQKFEQLDCNIIKENEGFLDKKTILNGFNQDVINILFPTTGCKCINSNKIRCSKCKRAFYCNSTCQKKYWTEHKKICCSQEEFTILEVGAGNGWHTKNIIEKYPFLNIISTDYLVPDVCYHKVKKYLSHEAVKFFKNKFNALLLISPPPGIDIYVDYYAIKEYELQQSTKKKIVIFIGELGASDGGRGMYHYMIHNSQWKLIYRKVVDEGTDPFGGPYYKEIFIFIM